TARSTTLPRIANSLNSEIMPIDWLPRVGRHAPPGEIYTRWRSGDVAVQPDQLVQTGTEAIARLQGGDAGRRAGEDQVAGAQVVQLRELMDDLGHREHHLVERGLLAQLAIDLQPQAARADGADQAGRNDLADGRGAVEALAGVPGQAGGLGPGL